ncbi:unnamed protein product [Sphagnum balticum]
MAMHSIPPCPLRQLCLRPQKRQRRIAAVAVTTEHCSFSCSCFSSLSHFSPTPSSCCFSSLAICHFSRLSQLATPRQRISRFHLGRNTGLQRRRWGLGNGFRNSDCFGANSSVFRKGGEILFCPSLTEQWSQWPEKRHHIGTQYGRQLGKFDKARVIVVRAAEQYPQNEDLPPVLPKRKKRPYVNPVKRGSFEKKLRRRAGLVPVKPLVAPQNGLLVKKLIPVAHMVLGARATVLDGVGRLLKVIPVKACRACPELYVGQYGHEIRSCQGQKSSARLSQHDWIPAYLDDVFVPVEAFHLADRLAKVPTHDQRFDIDRIAAIVELCIQAGVDLPKYPTYRRTSPIKGGRIGAIVEDVENSDSDMEDWMSSEDREDGDKEKGEMERKVINDEDDLQIVAEKTLHAWDSLREGARQLMKHYPVKACGYCPEVHVGPRGHRVRLCGAFKHQWRKGQHGWQEAALDDLIPPRYVWHVRDINGPPLKNSLRNYYGQAPIIVELCLQAGAKVPEQYKPRMRLDVVIPDLDEHDMVA